MRRNPFLPPEPPLVLSEIGGSHILLFNKYCVLHNHLLLISREFIHQDMPLELVDFEASEETYRLIRNQSDAGWMFFYNGGPRSGASQPHRHLQAVPDARPPITSIIDGSSPAPRIPVLEGIVYGFGLVDPSKSLSRSWWHLYQRFFKLCPHDSDKSYSLVFTAEWMLLVPRREEYSFGISYNSLAFVGHLLAKTEDELELIIRNDPVSILREMGFPTAQSH